MTNTWDRIHDAALMRHKDGGAELARLVINADDAFEALAAERDALKAERDKAVAMKDALVGDKIMLRSELAAVEGERNRLAALLEDAKGALEKIERWDDFPATGEFWPSGNPVSYTAQYGSDGARDFMRSIARATLAKLEKTDDQD